MPSVAIARQSLPSTARDFSRGHGFYIKKYKNNISIKIYFASINSHEYAVTEMRFRLFELTPEILMVTVNGGETLRPFLQNDH